VSLLEEGGTGMAISWPVFVAMVVVCMGIVALFDMGRELVKTLKRIDARLALISPLQEEQKVFDEPHGFLVRSDIRDRAIHPDVWWHLYYSDIKDLKGNELKEARGVWRSPERKR
jgi:hypothetical protein